MGKNTINIDGEKLRARIERLGLNMYKMPVEHGYTKNVIANSIKVGKASPLVVNLLSTYGIFKEDYEAKPDFLVKPLNVTLTRAAVDAYDNDPIFGMTRGELKELVKEAIAEVFNGATITRG